MPKQKSKTKWRHDDKVNKVTVEFVYILNRFITREIAYGHFPQQCMYVLSMCASTKDNLKIKWTKNKEENKLQNIYIKLDSI